MNTLSTTPAEVSELATHPAMGLTRQTTPTSQQGSTMTAAPTPTPYDTGDRLEAKPWLPYGTEVSEATPAENFGKVDFDDDESETVACVWVEKNDDGRYTVHVQSMIEHDQLLVDIHQG